MTPLQTAQLRAGDIRVRLSELAAETELTDETRAELEALRKEYADVERRAAALTVAEPDRTPIVSQTSEGNEYRQMVSRANVGTIFDDLLSHRATSGVEAELQAALRAEAGNQIPLDMLRGGGHGRKGCDSCPWASRPKSATRSSPTFFRNRQLPSLAYLSLPFQLVKLSSAC